jgi:hypothetical protein
VHALLAARSSESFVAADRKQIVRLGNTVRLALNRVAPVAAVEAAAMRYQATQPGPPPVAWRLTGKMSDRRNQALSNRQTALVKAGCPQ